MLAAWRWRRDRDRIQQQLYRLLKAGEEEEARSYLQTCREQHPAKRESLDHVYNATKLQVMGENARAARQAVDRPEV